MLFQGNGICGLLLQGFVILHAVFALPEECVEVRPSVLVFAVLLPLKFGLMQGLLRSCLVCQEARELLGLLHHHGRLHAALAKKLLELPQQRPVAAELGRDALHEHRGAPGRRHGAEPGEAPGQEGAVRPEEEELRGQDDVPDKGCVQPAQPMPIWNVAHAQAAQPIHMSTACGRVKWTKDPQEEHADSRQDLHAELAELQKHERVQAGSSLHFLWAQREGGPEPSEEAVQVLRFCRRANQNVVAVDEGVAAAEKAKCSQREGNH
mmetsp:Transcript_1365/g.3975  ORF Transcript_1365/g.3975 Transcript_1365/m.3975 type:complete len:265 (+) Transcript_1365:1571-2365(+)